MFIGNKRIFCFGGLTNMNIGQDCTTFCGSHANEVAAKLINVMFSDKLRVRFPVHSISNYPVLQLQLFVERDNLKCLVGITKNGQITWFHVYRFDDARVISNRIDCNKT
jgi:hypothetical protein